MKQECLPRDLAIIPSVPTSGYTHTDKGSVKIGDIHFVAMEVKIGNITGGQWYTVAYPEETPSLHYEVMFPVVIYFSSTVVPTMGRIINSGIQVFIPSGVTLGSTNSIELNFWYNNIN